MSLAAGSMRIYVCQASYPGLAEEHPELHVERPFLEGWSISVCNSPPLIGLALCGHYAAGTVKSRHHGAALEIPMAITRRYVVDNETRRHH